MTMVTCSECGRAVSDRAAVCIGCGAPIVAAGELELAGKATPAKPLTLAQIRRDLRRAIGILLLGLGAAIAADRAVAGKRAVALMAALLLITGIAWLLVTLVRLWARNTPTGS